ncbi:MAG: protein kinase [Nannocystis sp.]|uniref:serine/threonine protein kinase n=1 Tax=Nannocystis sp. TaxID=1962667 RepID=UPI002423C56B|nr:serine/threonine-protein kinase [Nannocystis sp.]MBK9753336.1 protein kinase [Nannocystis sp.]
MAGQETPNPARTIISAAGVPQPMTGEFVARSSDGMGAGMGANLVGVALLGRYQVQAHIGDGGMGTVYLAEHTTILKKFAVKVLSAELSVRPDHVDRFMREARSASMINHPNVVEITDFGVTPDGQPFFVMEYLQGKDLSQVLAEAGSLPWKRVRLIALQICHALQAAHDQGVIHRDMKPGNVVLVKRGNTPEHVKVLDFGIAKVLGQEGEVKGLTQSGMVVGTPEYMSPEQGWGQPVDHRGDIYALGVIIYELLTGKIPFSGSTMMEILNRHMFEVPDVKHPNIPDEVGAIILKAMQKDRALRFQSMNELGAAIEAVGTGASPVTVVDEEIKTPWGPVTARFTSVSPVVMPQQRSWVWLSVLSAVIAVGALVFAMWPDAVPAPVQPMQPVVAAPVEPSETPEVAPKPVVLPPEVEKVQFTITTPGVNAQILDARDEGIYGMTNDAAGVMVKKSDEPLELILRAKGFEDNRFSIIPNQDKRFDKVLAATKAGSTSKPVRPKGDPKVGKPDTKLPTETKAVDPGDDSGLGSDLKNPFGKK